MLFLRQVAEPRFSAGDRHLWGLPGALGAYRASDSASFERSRCLDRLRRFYGDGGLDVA